jgi:hypothetical protein
MRNTEVILRVINALIEKGFIELENLSEIARIPKRDVLTVLRELQFLDYIVIKKDKVYLSSKIYSLLFDAIIASKGVDIYFERNFKENAVKEIKTIPGLLIPILLLRAFSPYLAVILKDLKQEGKLQIDKTKEDFLFEYFSSRPIDFKPLKNWKEVQFESDEFYDLWITLNDELIKRIMFPINKGKRPKQSNSDNKITAITSFIDDLSTKIEALETTKQETEAITNIDSKTLIKSSQGSLPFDLELVRAIQISINCLIKFIFEQNSRRKGLVITLYENALSWEFIGEKILVPKMFLLKDGIYMEKRLKPLFTEKEIAYQVEYLEKFIKTAIELYGEKSAAGR